MNYISNNLMQSLSIHLAPAISVLHGFPERTDVASKRKCRVAGMRPDRVV